LDGDSVKKDKILADTTRDRKGNSVKTRRTLIVAFVVLCAATVLVVAYSAGAETAKSKSGQYYRVELLEETPQDYSVLTNPDPWLLQAIDSPGTSVHVENQYESSFLLQPSLESTFEYGGSYYSTEIIYVDIWFNEVLMRAVQIGVAGSWIVFGIMALINRKRLPF
jgi:hypothetical protein